MNLGSHFQNPSISLHSAHGKNSFAFESSYIILSSPDFNSLDLGAWYSLAAGVPSLKALPNQKMRVIDQIISHVFAQWRSWDAMTCLENIFATKQRIIQTVFASGGSNEYPIPRSFWSHQHEKASYIPEPMTPPLLLDMDGCEHEKNCHSYTLQSTPPLVLSGEWERNSQGQHSFSLGQDNDVMSYWRRRLS